MYLCNSFLSACDGIRLLLTESTESEMQDDDTKKRSGGSLASGIWMNQNVIRV